MQLLFHLYPDYPSPKFQGNNAAAQANVCQTQIAATQLLPPRHSKLQSTLTQTGHDTSTQELWTGI